jgi:hypothetical protein
MEDLLGD